MVWGLGVIALELLNLMLITFTILMLKDLVSQILENATKSIYTINTIYLLWINTKVILSLKKIH